MTSTLEKRRLLLGVSTAAPPDKLKRGATFQSLEEYKSFLNDAQDDAAAYWSRLADKVTWSKAPAEVGGPGGWFPGGELNLSVSCLDEPARRFRGTEPVLWEIPPGSHEPAALTRDDLLGRVGWISSQVREWSLGPGDRVLVALPSGGPMLAATYACLRLGLTVVPMDPAYAGKRITRRARKLSCKGAIVDSQLLTSVDLAVAHTLTMPTDTEAVTANPGTPIPVTAMHPAFVLADSAGQLFTIPGAGFLVQAISAYRNILDGRGDSDRLWVLAPSHHASTMAAATGALAAGGQVGFLPCEAASSTTSFLDMISAAGPRVLFSDVKTVMQAIRPAMEAGQRPMGDGPDLFIIEGEAVEPRIWAYLENGLFRSGTHVVQVLARPESGGFVAGPNPAVTPVRRSSVALPAPGFDIVILDAQGHECEPNHGGFLGLNKATPGLALELQKLVPPLAIEVKARRDVAGYIWTMGEVKVSRAGRDRVTIPELEAVIASVRGVDQVAMIRYRDKQGNSKSRVFFKPIRHADGLTDEIRERIIERCGERAMPDSFQVVRALPCSRTGKLLRTVLKRLAEGESLSREDLDLISDPNLIEEYNAAG
ncbi:MAG: acyl-CoA synthetase [Deltaproteobacteria bacterium]|nr:acyl-CoA synthetase [Deltaproteobacteria bacterium]